MKILLAIEDEGFARMLVEFVASHRWKEDLQFKVLYVLEPIAYLGELQQPANSLSLEVLEERRRAGIDLISKFAGQLKTSFPCSRIAVEMTEGLPKEEIVAVAEQWKADIIVIGSHKRQGVAREILGSVSSAVVAQAPCSVIMVKKTKQGTAPLASAFRHVGASS